MKSFAVTALLASLPTAFTALPDDITAVPLPDGCASYPAYDAETGTAGPWLIQAVNTENPAIEGFSDTNVYSIAIADRKPTIRWGYITIPTRNDIAKTRLQCSNNTLQAWTDSDLTPAGAPTNVQWLDLLLSPYPYDQPLMYKLGEGLPVKTFEHWRDGQKQEGVYLGGYDNATTWGFTYYPADQGSSGLDYYYMRLLGPDSADPSTGEKLGKNETRGFLRVVV